MAKDIHLKMTPINVKCSGCSNTFEVHTTIEGDSLDIENCNQCSPVYTGKRRSNMSGHGSAAFKKRFSGFDTLTSISKDKDSK